MGLFGIYFYQVIVSGSKLDVVDPRKIAHPVMYDTSISFNFPRSSLRTNRQTNKQTNKQTDMLVLLIWRDNNNDNNDNDDKIRP